MIRRLFSSLAVFKSLEFGPGLNVLIADMSPGASALQTRNRAGKSSLIELVHFLTGSNVDTRSIFRRPALRDHFFAGEFDIGGRPTVVRRSGQRASRVEVQGLDVSAGAEQIAFDSEWSPVSTEQWKDLLGARWFGLPVGADSAGAPSFRLLFPYFARRDASGGFLSPFKHFTRQSSGDEQAAMSYLLGLDWTISAQFQRLRDQDGALQALRAAASLGAFPAGPRPSGQLRTLVAVAEERAARALAAVAGFRVLPEYETLEAEADSLTARMSNAADLDSADLRLASRLREALAIEEVRSTDHLGEVYEEAGLVFPQAVVRRLDEVSAFHASVVANRRGYLEQELAGADDRVSQRRREMASWDLRREEILRVLQSHGALSQLAELQAEVARLAAHAARLRQEFDAAERVEGIRTDIEIERGQLTRRLHQDFTEREAVLRHAIVTFEEFSRALYTEAGRLEISESPSGPTFRVTIQGGESHGVRNMQVFCLDLTLARLTAERGLGPGFLIHDSHLFDGVDERQVGSALKLGSDLADDLGMQYIVTLNSDVVPVTLPAGFDLDSHVLPVRLTDKQDDGGLFGLRF